MNPAENEKWNVKHIRQSEVQDIFEITNKLTGESEYDKYSRSMGQTCENILSYLD